MQYKIKSKITHNTNGRGKEFYTHYYVAIPNDIALKYLEKPLIIKETENGILVSPATNVNMFVELQEALDKIKSNPNIQDNKSALKALASAILKI